MDVECRVPVRSTSATRWSEAAHDRELPRGRLLPAAELGQRLRSEPLHVGTAVDAPVEDGEHQRIQQSEEEPAHGAPEEGRGSARARVRHTGLDWSGLRWFVASEAMSVMRPCNDLIWSRMTFCSPSVTPGFSDCVTALLT
jgi:hypothetical protein